MTRLGIIGAGIMGERLLRAAQDHSGLVIGGIWDPADAALGRIAGDWPGAALPSARAVIEAADCVYIASPPSTHLAHARAALAAGKAVFCEKPLSVDVGDGERLLAEAAGGRVAVNFPFATSLAVERLSGWLAEGAVGAAESVSISVAFATWPRGWQHAAAGWLDRPEQGGFTREVVSHLLFLARRLFGPPTVLEARAEFPDPARSERSIAARLSAGPITVVLEGRVGETDEDDVNAFTITGPGGAIRLRNWGTAERHAAGLWESDPAALPHELARPLGLKRQLDEVIQMTRGERHTLATIGEAFDVQTAIEAILRGKVR